MAGVDLDRGVCQRRHPEGMLIGCYYDDPGAYFDENGEPVSEEVAAQAGHDVKRARVERVKRERLAEAKRQIEAEVADLERRIEAEAEDAFDAPRIDLADAPESGYGVVHVGGQYYRVIDPAGSVVSGPKALLKEAAEKLAHDLLAAASSSAAAASE